MRKIYSIIAIITAVVMFTSCSDNDAAYLPTPKLEITSANVLFDADGGNGSIEVNASAVSATTSVNWLSLSVQGNKVIVTANPNLTLEDRSALIKLVSGSTEAKVTATQKGSAYGLTGGMSYELSDLADASVSIPIVHTSEVTVKSLTDWLTASFNSETSEIKVVAQSNDEEENRVGYVALETGSIKDTLEIVQNAMLFKLEKTSLTVGNEGGVEKVTIEHSKPVTAEATVDWLKCSFNNKTGVLSITVDENKSLARQGTVTVKSGNSEKTISVIQYDPASLADQIVGNYYLTFYDGEGTPRSLAATLTEEALLIPALNWAIPVTIDKENLTVSVNSGCFVGTYLGSYYSYLLFVNETDEYWTGDGTESVASAALGLEDIGGGNLTLAGSFDGTFGTKNYKFGSFLFGAFPAQSLDMNNYLGALTQLYAPALMKVPESSGAKAVPARLSRTKQFGVVPSLLKKRFKK
ncbi:MAG: BACON domain-containing protein [Bacteroidaceae bacterium]|nr:BACON domain-containing protein [Bacteroidaceae bacterium]